MDNNSRGTAAHLRLLRKKAPHSCLDHAGQRSNMPVGYASLRSRRYSLSAAGASHRGASARRDVPCRGVPRPGSHSAAVDVHSPVEEAVKQLCKNTRQAALGQVGRLLPGLDRPAGRERPRLDAQRRAVADYLNGGKWVLAAEYTEVESGNRSDNRPKLASALAACKRLKAKFIVAKLDRLSRNVALIPALMSNGVEFVAADMPHANEMTLQVLAVFAEHERDQISARTKQALAAAKCAAKNRD